MTGEPGRQQRSPMANNTLYNNLFASLISEIKAYSGRDPLLPWLRGIKKMRESLPTQLLKEKLPRFLQKCAQTFQTDRRYANDLRYLRVWLQLMDFVNDPGAVLGTMEAHHIGMKRALFYQAYALYYEKVKKFEEAEKMYHLGVKNLAEPVNELQKSFEQFLHRMERHKNKRVQVRQGGRSSRPPCTGSIPDNRDDDKENNDNVCKVKGRSTGSWTEKSLPRRQPKLESIENKAAIAHRTENNMPKKESTHFGVATNRDNVGNLSIKKGYMEDIGCKNYVNRKNSSEAKSDEARKFSGDDTVVVKFVDTAIVGKPEAEDACHHGLVEPTINTKDAMNAINSMFREPLEPAITGGRSHRSQPKSDKSRDNEFEVFIDDDLDNGVGSSNKKLEKCFSLPQHKRPETHQPLQEPLQIYTSDEENNMIEGGSHEKDNSKHRKVQKVTKGATVSGGQINAFVSVNSKDLPSECVEDLDVERPQQVTGREDTVVYRFVGSTISDEPEVENVCHHGLVEPTVNLKEAMDDINNMFGKPIEFARKSRKKKQNKIVDGKRDCSTFLILPDDDMDCQQQKFQPSSSTRRETDLFEPTICTKEAMDEINKMFGMPMDF
ncbi:hypothetical protein RJ640_026338 [Escallonia rubra]|uniref:BUB1 N-terminal domain-containing protein n=1 Tax=Escallonia rubra TaxID=112253 RepID=A0AA88S497_9ASTE|nr:hypothetical protein RJ640_026338 [Escallonia rubra]